MLKNIVFDLGNVLIEWNPNQVYDKYFADTKQRDEFYATTQIQKLNLEFDRGLSFNTGLAQLATKFPEYADAIWLWKHSWSDMLGNEIAGCLDIIKVLKSKRYPLYALTNWAAETFLYAEANLKFLNNFIDIVVSGREKVVKPDPQIFNILLERNKLSAAECVFIDDSLANVQAAHNLGFCAIHFKSPEQLITNLKQLNIL